MVPKIEELDKLRVFRSGPEYASDYAVVMNESVPVGIYPFWLALLESVTGPLPSILRGSGVIL